uniref:Tuftelin 1a n=1 Tax=Electrophorus electricus TaxID=8005 RepID=A0A4W4ETH3_ELEEL
MEHKRCKHTCDSNTRCSKPSAEFNINSFCYIFLILSLFSFSTLSLALPRSLPLSPTLSLPYSFSLSPSVSLSPFLSQNEESEEDPARMREVSRRLYSQLQEAERRHQEEREKLQLSEQSKRLKQAHDSAQQQDQQIRELQRLMGGMEQESSSLREELLIREAKLLQLQELKEEAEASRESVWCTLNGQMSKENAILREKIHHLDDMLKSQQRKLRQMIEQLQNSRMLIQERDRVIKDLEEKVAFLEAENKQMRDQMDYLLDGQRSSSHLLPDHNAQIVYR